MEFIENISSFSLFWFNALSSNLQISCIASVYNLYNERVDKTIDEDRPTVFSASASQSFIDLPSSHYSSYHDSQDTVNNHNDAQIQGKCCFPFHKCEIHRYHRENNCYSAIDGNNTLKKACKVSSLYEVRSLHNGWMIEWIAVFMYENNAWN